MEENMNPHVLVCLQPTCNAPAAVVERWSWPSTDGPVEHVKVRCLDGHWFTPMADWLAARRDRHAVSEPGAQGRTSA